MKVSLVNILLLSFLGLFSVGALADSHEDKEAHRVDADTNQDGKISLEEFKSARDKKEEAHFKRMDTNGDGFIDQDEKKVVKQKMKELREKRKQKQSDK